jgi:hypothetical protein
MNREGGVPVGKPASFRRGSVVLVFVGLALAMAGGIFTFLLGRGAILAMEMRQWPEVPCLVTESGVDLVVDSVTGKDTYRTRIRFLFTWEGREITGDRIRRVESSSVDEGKMRRRIEPFPKGLQTTCRVPVESPEKAVLRPESMGPLYSIWFPGLFVLGGLVLVVRAWPRDG